MPTTIDIESQRMLVGTTPVRKIYQGTTLLGARIAELFAQGEQGVWYDPSDLSTLFQDAAGTVPVTAVEQPVGLMLDKSKGLVLGALTAAIKYNNATPGKATYTNNPDGSTTCVANLDASGSYAYNGFSLEVEAGKTYLARTFSDEPTFRIYYAHTAGQMDFVTVLGSGGVQLSGEHASRLVIPSGKNRLLCVTQKAYPFVGSFTTAPAQVRELLGDHASQPTATSRPVLSARVNQYLATETLATQNVTTLAAQYRLSFEGTGTITLSGAATGVYSAGSHLITCTAGTLTSTVSGSVTKADLRVANDGVNLPPYQRVNTATDYDTVGFPHYLRFDGVDDWLVTPTITPGTDKVQVFAGVRKLSDAASVIAELSAAATGNNGAILLAHNGSGAPTGYNFVSRGTSAVDFGANGYFAPITNILAGLGNISGDSAILRINGVQAAQNTVDQGTGNYLAYPLYIGRRGGTTFPFNGRLYSLIVRFGSNLPTATIEQTEKYINQKTRAY